MSQLPFEHGLVEVEPGVQLHYVQTGVGARTIVLLHGYPETWWQWRHTMPVLAAAGYRVIAIDYRGAGNSSKPPVGYDKFTMAGDVRTLLVGHRGVDQPVLMVGHDIGMTVAFAYAGRYPDDVEKLVLVDAIIPGTKVFRELLTTGKLKNSNLAHFFFHNARNNMAETLTAGRERVYLQDFFDRIAHNIGAFPPEVIDMYAKAYAAPGAMRAGFEVYRAFDQDAEYNIKKLKESGKLRMPVLFVAGRESFLSTIAENILQEVAADGSVAVVANSGHYPAEENPSSFADIVLEFCKTEHAA
jgi:Predicted hydrolases or acyltransferases (alpha/beta hydrolase superfamily)